MLNALKYLIFTIIVTGLMINLSPQSSYANGNNIKVLNQTIESDFPNGIKFHLEAKSSDAIDDIRVYFRKMGQSGDSGYRIVDFDTGTHIYGESKILSNKDNQYIAPGTRIEYYYDIRDVTGRVFKTDPQIYTYLDNRFEWKTVTDGVITVFYFGSGTAEKAEQILDICKATLDLMGPILGIEPAHPLHIVTYEDYSDMKVGLPFRSKTVSNSLITNGIAFADERSLIIYASDNSFVGTTKHEFTHLLVGDAAGRAYNRVPLWLNEGLAEYANTEGNYQSYLQSAIQNGDLLPLWQRETFSGTPRDIMIGYGQGESVVQFMIDEYGTKKIASLMTNIQSAFDIDSALESSHGFNQYGLDSLWREHMELPQLPDPDVYAELDTPTPAHTASIKPTPTINTLASTLPDSKTERTNVEPINTRGTGGCYAAPDSHSDFSTIGLIGLPIIMSIWRKSKRRDD